MNIGILGAGSVGVALGLAWSRSGHRVQLGVRDPAVPRPQPSGQDALELAGLPQAASNEVVVLATPWAATVEMVRGLDLAGRLVIDATNPVSVRNGVLLREPTTLPSGAQDVAAVATGASVFKTLNQAGANILGAAHRLQSRPLMFIAGDDAAGKARVSPLVAALGFDVRDAGGLANAVHLESLAWLWIHQALTGPAGRGFAFAAVPA